MNEEEDVEMSQPDLQPKTLNVFGVSNLSTKEIVGFIESLFASLNVNPEAKVEWIDDDSCNVLFPDDAYVDHCLISGSPMEGSSDGSISIICPATMEGGQTHPLKLRRAVQSDSKRPNRTWRDSKYYKKRLEDKGINPVTLAPASRVILKPREGARPPVKSKVTLIPRRHINLAKNIIYGDEAFSKRKSHGSMDVDEHELKRREERAKRFSSHN
jgi:hypothetical protein